MTAALIGLATFLGGLVLGESIGYRRGLNKRAETLRRQRDLDRACQEAEMRAQYERESG